MARLSQLVPTVANVLGVPEKTVNVFSRNLREAGLISSGGRGPGGAHMTPFDAANLIIAVAGSNLVKDAVETVKHYAELPAISSEHHTQTDAHNFENFGNEPPIWDLRGFPIVGLRSLPHGHSFREALAALIASAANGSLRDTIEDLPKAHVDEHTNPTIYSIEVTLRGPYPQASIRLWTTGFDERMRYGEEISMPDYETAKKWERETSKRFDIKDLKQMREFTEVAIFALGDLLSDKPR